MAVGTGIGLDISQLDAEIKKADEALMSLGKTGERTSKQINEAFSLAKNGNIQDFISVIERLSNTLSKKGYNQAAQMVREIATETTGAIDRVNRFATLMQTINDGGRSNVKNGAIESLKYQLDEALSRLGVLNEQLQFYAKGAGAKAVGANVVDTSALQDEANKLRVVVELLQRRLESEQAIAALKRRSGSIEKQQSLDSSWQRMEEIRTKELQQQSINAKEANKAYEQAYNDRYQMYASMYDKMWQKDLENFSKQNASAKSGGQQYAAEYEQKRRYYERWINETYLKEQERTQQEAQQANERARNSSAAYQQELREKERFYLDWINKTFEADERRRKKEEEEEKKKNERIAAEAKKAAEAQARLDSESRKRRYHAYTTSYEGAIRTSDKAKTLAQEIQAVKNLEAARAKLVKTDADYQKKLDDINARILQHNRNIAQATAGAKDLQNAHSKLGTTIASVFSIQAIRGYINQMIKVRGEMELQQRSLQAILQDKDKANEVWQKTIDLAVKSPFRINQLVNYTKQLAAYRVEADKLYDTNKMLADVSAGLGVDMQRLILAFGQVKAANFLRGTELRQFTEAGIPMLDELAKLYRDMGEEGVTAADVFDRISKRMVLFEDVEKVFERMTSASGTFYRMQEIQSETLKGQISNLKDSIDIMLNDMGKTNDGILKFSVKTVKLLVDNYESLIPVLKALIAYLALYKISAFKASEATLVYARSMNMAKVSGAGLGGMWTSLRVSLHKFGASMGNTLKMLSANPWILLATAVVASVTAFVKYRNELKKVNKEYAELRNRQAEITAKYYKTTDLDKQKEALKELIEYAEKEYSIEVEVDIKSMSREEVKRKMNELRQQLLEANAFGVTFQQELIRANAHTKWDDFGTRGIFEQGLFKDIDDMGNAYDELNTLLVNSLNPTIDMLANKWGNLTEEQKESLQMQLAALQSLKHGIGDWSDEDEDMVEYFDRLRKNFQLLVDSGDITDRKLKRALKAYRRDYDEAVAEFEVFAKRIDATVNAIESDEDKTIRLNAAIDDAKFEREWSVFEETVIRRLLSKRYSINLVPQIEEDDDSLKAWQESYMRKFAGKAGYRPIEDEGTSQAQVIERLQGTYQSLEEQIKRIKKAGKDSVLTGGAYEGEPIEKLERQLKEVKAQLDWFGASAKKGGGGSGKDVVMERLRNRINLIKEMNKEYEKLNKTFSKAESLAKVQKAYADTAKELGLDTSTMDFTDEGTIKSLEALLGKPEYEANKYAIELKKALDGLKAELNLEVDERHRQRILDEVQDIFDKYELSIELKKLNIPNDVTKNLFGVETKTFEQMRNEIIAKFAEGSKEAQDILTKGILSAEDATKLAEIIGTKQVEEARKAIEKIDDLEEKQQLESAKRLAKFLTQNLDQTKVVLQQRGIDIAFAKKQFDDGAISAEQFAETVKNIVAQSNEEISKFNLEKFKESPEYIQAMGDLTAYSITELEGLKAKLQELITANGEAFSAEEMLVYQRVLEKIGERIDLLDDNLWFKDSDIKTLQEIKRIEGEITEEKKKEAEATAKLTKFEAERAALVAKLSMLEEQRKTALASGASTVDIDNQILDITSQIATKNEEILKVQGTIKKSKTLLAELGEEMNRILDGQTKAMAKVEASINLFNKSLALATDTYANIKEVADSFGADTESLGWKQAENVMGMLQGFGSSAASAAGKFATGDIFGGVMDSLKAIKELIVGINKMHDDALEDTIQKHLEDVENLQKEYEKLEWVIGRAFSFDRYGKVAEQTKNLGKQIENTSKAISLEEDKKDTDEERIKELRENAEEAKKQIHELYDNLRQEIVGSYEDLSSTLADAMIEAFKSGEDALKAWGDSVDEIIADIITKLAVQKYVEPQVSRVLDQFYNKVMPKNAAAEKAFTRLQSMTVGTKEYEEALAEWEKLNSQAIGELPQLTESSVGALRDSLNAIGISFEPIAEQIASIFGGQGGGLSALQKGIQGITEDTAQIIEAYLNSIRGYVSEQVTHTKNIYRILNDAVHSDAAAIRVRMV